MSERPEPRERLEPEISVRLYSGNELVERRFSTSDAAVGEIVRSWQDEQPPRLTAIVVEPWPPESIVETLRAIADSIEEECPLDLLRPTPHVRLQLDIETAAASTSRDQPQRVWQELSHPGD
jgi:hypothetical protein